MSIIINYLKDMLLFIVISMPIIFILRYLIVKNMKKNNIDTNVFHEVGLTLFILFLVGLASQAIFSEIVSNGVLSFSFSFDYLRINLSLFKVVQETYIEVFINDNFNYFLINFLGNIVMFMPIGFFVGLLWENITFKKIVIIGFLTSLFIEICQLPLNRGSDIDDIWINVLGCVIGYLVFLLIKRILPLLVDKFKINGREI